MPARTTSGPMPSPPMTPISTTALCLQPAEVAIKHGRDIILSA
jgi:hypothetical protein